MKIFKSIFSILLVVLMMMTFFVIPSSAYIGESLTTWLHRLPGGKLYLRNNIWFERDTTYFGVKPSTRTVCPYELVQEGNRALIPATAYALFAASSIVISSELMIVSSTGTTTSTAAPFISTSAYTNGTLVTLVGGTTTLILQDSDTLPNSGMQLGASTRQLATGDKLTLLLYANMWYELAYFDYGNVQAFADITANNLTVTNSTHTVMKAATAIVALNQVTHQTVTNQTVTGSTVTVQVTGTNIATNEQITNLRLNSRSETNITMSSTSAITVDSAYLLLTTTGGPVNVYSAPTIADGTAGDVLILEGSATDIAGLQDQDTLPDSNLQLGGALRQLDANDTLMLMFNGTDWIEIGFNDN